MRNDLASQGAENPSPRGERRRSMYPAGLHLIPRYRAPDQIALDQGAADAAQQVQFLLPFDAFGHDLHIEPAAEIDDALDHPFRPGIAEHVLDEGAVDLDFVELEAREIAEAGEAGPEIVDRQPDAVPPQRFQHAGGEEDIVEQPGL